MVGEDNTLHYNLHPIIGFDFQTKNQPLAIAESHAHQEKTHGAVPRTESEISNPGSISRHTKYGQHGE
jgi:hypothetical protein